MTIAEQVRGLADGHEAALPAEVKSAFAREQAELAALEPVEVIAVGELLPDSDLIDAHTQRPVRRLRAEGNKRNAATIELAQQLGLVRVQSDVAVRAPRRPGQQPGALLERLRTGGTGQTWNVSD